MASEEESDDSGNNDAGSRYDTMTFLSHLPDVQSLQGPIGGGSTSRASRVASAPVEREEERPEERAHEGPSERRSAKPKAPLTTSVALRTCAQSPCTSSGGGAVASMPEVEAPSSGVRTRGQTTAGASSAQARGCSRPTRGLTEGLSPRASGGSGKPGTKPLIPMSG
jgi:hypothetical protein